MSFPTVSLICSERKETPSLLWKKVWRDIWERREQGLTGVGPGLSDHGQKPTEVVVPEANTEERILQPLEL